MKRLAWALAACAAQPRAPAPAVVADVRRAEDAELARKHDVARAEYLRAIADAKDPQSEAFARHEYAETLQTWGELGEMQVQLEQVVAISPLDASAWHDLGLLYHHAGDDPRAITALERAKQLAPRDYRPRRTLAALWWARHDFARAAAEYQDLLHLDLPDRLREKVRWALDQLARPDHGLAASPPSS
jgi:Flp pilus assembly protein TadD